MSRVRLMIGDGVARVTLHRPERRNALLPQMWHELGAIGRTVMVDPTVRCVLVSGDGPAFSSGLDRDVLAAGGITPAALTGDPADAGRSEFRNGDLSAAHASYRWLSEGPFVSIAAVQGHALGAGFQLALACDHRVVATDAQFGFPELAMGLIPDVGGMNYLPRIVGYSRALDLILSGRRIDAAEALRLGIADRVVDTEALATEAASWANALSTLPPAAVAAVKNAIRAGARGDDDESFRITDAGQIALLSALNPGRDHRTP